MAVVPSCEGLACADIRRPYVHAHRFTDIRVGNPSRLDFNEVRAHNEVTPMECRLRDMTYAAPIYVDIAFIRDKKKIVKRNVQLGRMPVMLRSSTCHLSGANNSQRALMNGSVAFFGMGVVPLRARLNAIAADGSFKLR